VLYDDTTRQIYDLEPQAQALGNLGNSVTVEGALDDGTIHVSSLELLTSIGLPVGQKAPPFSARDQFGQDQTLESLTPSKHLTYSLRSSNPIAPAFPEAI
jgi:hypothetical protein